MVEHLEFDTIYHEHLSYFSVAAIDRLMTEAGLVLWDVEAIGLHGGSLIARAKKKKAGAASPTANVARFLAAEKEAGYDTMAPLTRFADGTRRLKDAIPAFLRGLALGGKTVAAYGAAAKGVVLTNYCGIGPDTVSFVADRSPYKQGKKTPGMHLPVVAPERVLSDKPDYVLVLAWNFLDEIRKQLAAYETAGGRFVVPVPEPKVIGS
jgi:hypothetical protein